METSLNPVIRPWVGPGLKNMLNMGSWDGSGGYRYSTPPSPPASHHPGYTPPPTPVPVRTMKGAVQQTKYVVGLKSVDQLSLSDRISGSHTMTEVYNLSKIGRITNH